MPSRRLFQSFNRNFGKPNKNQQIKPRPSLMEEYPKQQPEWWMMTSGCASPMGIFVRDEPGSPRRRFRNYGVYTKINQPDFFNVHFQTILLPRPQTPKHYPMSLIRLAEGKPRMRFKGYGVYTKDMPRDIMNLQYQTLQTIPMKPKRFVYRRDLLRDGDIGIELNIY